MSRKQLLIQALVKVTAGILLVGLLLFVPAGTLHYPNGWLLMGILFLPMLAAGFTMFFLSPQLLEKRLQAKEKESTQKTVVLLSGFMFIFGFVAAGLCFRFGLKPFPVWVVRTGAILFLLSYLLYAEVLRENAYLSRTIEVQSEQKLIDTGLYGIVRHPMYAATIVLFLSMPLVLGAPLAFPIFLFYPWLIAKRIQNEEQVLAEGLAGYADYQKRVRYRLIPFVW